MKTMEQQELDAYRQEMAADMRRLIEKYRSIFGWDIPEIDQSAADQLILGAMHTALDDIPAKLTP
jgi:hypothetical protein